MQKEVGNYTQVAYTKEVKWKKNYLQRYFVLAQNSHLVWRQH